MSVIIESIRGVALPSPPPPVSLFGTSILLEAHVLLDASPVSTCTACAIFHRAMHAQQTTAAPAAAVAVVSYSPWDIAIASSLLALKATECDRRLKDVIICFYAVHRKRCKIDERSTPFLSATSPGKCLDMSLVWTVSHLLPLAF
jgi:hypothetical protein